ncbi:hypothetical protein [Streptomyces sp. NPDC050264]|uniref:hypothetical protein n=1 Tax=Streptomyces sp. NPDC050264 TaxID=3155038 RepID=UPI0034370B67
MPVAVPPLGALSELQLRGCCCAWCAVTLAVGRSVDLGERELGGRRVFPRGCPTCTTIEVYIQVLDHATQCARCKDTKALCPETADLRRALKEGRQL